MNKQKFVDYLRSPERLTEGQFEELQKLLTDYPYFSIAKSIAARGAKDLELESKNQLIASAAIYATDRKHLKRYINGELVFLVDPPVISEEEIEEAPIKSDETIEKESNREESIEGSNLSEAADSTIVDEIPAQPSSGNEMDQVLDELQRDIKELEKSRMHFLEVQDHLDDNVKFTNKATPEVKETIDEELTDSSETSRADIIEEPVVDKKVVEEPIVESTEDKETEPLIKEKKEPKLNKESAKKDFGLDLEALKREFALETDDEKENEEEVNEELPVVKAPKIIGNMDDDDEEDEEDAAFFPPPPTDSPTAITNMSPDEEEPDDEAEIIQKRPKGEKRKPRKAVKMKRDDFEKILGKKVDSDKPKESQEDEVKTETSTDVVKPFNEAEIEDKQPKEEVDIEKLSSKSLTKEKKSKTEDIEEPVNKQEALSQPKTEETPEVKTTSKISDTTTSTDSTDMVKMAMSKMDKASSISKANTSKRKKKVQPKRDPETDIVPIEIIRSEPKKTSKPKTSKKETKDEENEEMASRNSVKSFLELGRSNESTSISRASTSKRRGRNPKSKPASGDSSKSSGSKDDDESGRASSLIDKFISENPSIQRRELGDTKSDLSENSVKWHPELASEYLAQIYIDQGNKARAITIYETLSLKFPEKKSYFAGLIKKLKK